MQDQKSYPAARDEKRMKHQTFPLLSLMLGNLDQSINIEFSLCQTNQDINKGKLNYSLPRS